MGGDNAPLCAVPIQLISVSVLYIFVYPLCTVRAALTHPSTVCAVRAALTTLSSLLQVTAEHGGTYRCQPYNLYGTGGESGEMLVQVLRRPRFVLRPRNLYQRRVLDTVQLPCVVDGEPTPEVTWRRVSEQRIHTELTHTEPSQHIQHPIGATSPVLSASSTEHRGSMGPGSLT